MTDFCHLWLSCDLHDMMSIAQNLFWLTTCRSDELRTGLESHSLTTAVWMSLTLSHLLLYQASHCRTANTKHVGGSSPKPVTCIATGGKTTKHRVSTRPYTAHLTDFTTSLVETQLQKVFRCGLC